MIGSFDHSIFLQAHAKRGSLGEPIGKGDFDFPLSAPYQAAQRSCRGKWSPEMGRPTPNGGARNGTILIFLQTHFLMHYDLNFNHNNFVSKNIYRRKTNENQKSTTKKIFI